MSAMYASSRQFRDPEAASPFRDFCKSAVVTTVLEKGDLSDLCGFRDGTRNGSCPVGEA